MIEIMNDLPALHAVIAMYLVSALTKFDVLLFLVSSFRTWAHTCSREQHWRKIKDMLYQTMKKNQDKDKTPWNKF